MIRHIIIWKLKETLTAEERSEVKQNAKQALEALVGVVPGLVSMRIEIAGLPSSTGDMMLVSELENEAALEGYRTHPAHVKAADTFVRPYTALRSAFDYRED